MISVIIPVYNGEKYLMEAIYSVLNQPIKEIEIICINDGSTDSSAEILAEIQKREPRLVVETQKNKGVASARNLGIQIAKGEYVAFLDQDDAWCENILNEIVWGKVTAEKYDVVSFAYYHTNQDMSRGRFVSRESIIRNDIAQFASENYRHHSSYFFSTLFLRDNKIEVDEYRNEDERFRMSCIYRAKKALYVAEPLFMYRNNQQSVTHKKGKVSNVILSCLDGYTTLLKREENDYVRKYCESTIVHLMLELMEALAGENENKETLLLYLEKYIFKKISFDDVWMSKKDAFIWRIYLWKDDVLMILLKIKTGIIKCLRFVLKVKFLRNIYEHKKYPIALK